MKEFTESIALRSLHGKGCKISGKDIEVPVGNLGINTLSKVDYLVKVHGYDVRFKKTEQNKKTEHHD